MRQNSDFSSKNKETFLPKLICASSEESADILYASSFHAPDEFIYFETAEKKGIIVSPLEYSRACSEASKDIEVIDRSEMMRSCGVKNSFLVYLSRSLGISRWLVPERFPLAYALELQKAGIEAVCSQSDFFPERLRKNRTEIAEIRKSVLATEEMMRYLQQMLRESKVNSQGYLELAGKPLTSEFLRSELEGTFKKMGFTASRTILSHGVQCAAPHDIGSGAIRKEETIVADIFPRSDVSGYWGDMTRTFLKGKAPKSILRAYHAVKDASEKAMEQLKAGVVAAEVHATAAESMASAGFQTGRSGNGMPCGFIHGLGHGVGLEIHEGPRVSPMNRNPLQTGNVVSIEPGLYYPEWGGIRLEDLVVITRDSYRNFNSMEKELEIG